MAGGILSGAASGAQAGMIAGPYGAAIGAVVGGVLGALSYKPPQAPKLSKDTLDPVTTGQSDFLDQSQHIGAVGDLIQQANDASNSQFQSNITKFDPDAAATTTAIGNAGAALAGGKLPGNFNTGGPNGRTLTAADLGMTSDQLVGQGGNLVGAGEKSAQAFNPFNDTSTSTLLTPAALLQRRDAAGYYNTNLTNQAALGKATANAINPFATGVATGLGSVGQSLRGLTGQGQNGSQFNNFGGQDYSGPTGLQADGSFIGDLGEGTTDAAAGAADAAGSAADLADVADVADI